jgi:hypothetical protein
LGKAESELDAQGLVKVLKTPPELDKRMVKFQKQLQKTQTAPNDKYTLFNTLIGELIGMFPNALPIQILLTKGKEVGLEEEFIITSIALLKENGYILERKDHQNNAIFKFLNLPITFQKYQITRAEIDESDTD